MPGMIRRFFSNVVCGFVPNRDRRRLVRVVLNSDVFGYLRFIRRDCGGIRLRKIKMFVGYQARSLLISVNDKFIYKFPLRRDDSDALALRESRIVSALAPLSPIYVPPVVLLKYKNRIVRKYEFIPGVQFRHLPFNVAYEFMDQIAEQIADFMYKIGCENPVSIRDLKPGANKRSGYMFGWTQGDIYDNFLVDATSGRVVAMIDWEDAFFGDFAYLFKNQRDPIAKEFVEHVARCYDRMYRYGMTDKES